MKKITFAFLVVVFILAGCGPAATPTPVEGGVTLQPFLGAGATDTAMPDGGVANTPSAVLADEPTLASQGETQVGDVTQPLLDWKYKFFSIDMVDEKNGWAEAGIRADQVDSIFRTVDGGYTWFDVTPAPPLSSDHSLFSSTGMLEFGRGDLRLVAFDVNSALLIQAGSYGRSMGIGPAAIYFAWRTDDGGQSWGLYPIINGGFIDPVILSPDFLDKDNGWVGVLGPFEYYKEQNGPFFGWGFFETSDGGMNWQPMPDNSNCAEACTGPIFTSSTTALRSPATRIIESVLPLSEDVWQIEKTIDGGATWDYLPLDIPAELQDQFSGMSRATLNCTYDLSRLKASAVGLRLGCDLGSDLNFDHYFISTDEGEFWHSFPVAGGVFFLDASTGWRQMDTKGVLNLERTTDGGKTWKPMTTPGTSGAQYEFIDLQNGWAIPNNAPDGVIYKTGDGGQSWEKIEAEIWTGYLILPLVPGQSIRLDSIQMFDAKAGWGVDTGGHIVHTEDGGSTWRDSTPPLGSYTSNLFFASDEDTAWAMTELFPDPNYFASQYIVYHSTDGGLNWDVAPVLNFSEEDIGFNPIRLFFEDEQTGWIMTDAESPWHMLKTIDGGQTWLTGETAITTVPPYIPSYRRLESAYLFESLEEVRSGGIISIDIPEDLAARFDRANENLGGLTCEPRDFQRMPGDLLGISGICDLSYSLDGLNYRNYSVHYYEFHTSERTFIWSNVVSAYFLNEIVGWRLTAVPGSDLYFLEQTFNGGDTWSTVKTVTWNGQLDFVDGYEGWVLAHEAAWPLGNRIYPGDTVLLHTSDGGKNWLEIKPVVGE